jgi:metal-responsive CopG/Arc/MetJ family transcriptional regulator
MASKAKETAQLKDPTQTKRDSARISVSFPRDLYETLDRIAKNKKVSVAWVVRDAAEKYVADQWPLLQTTQ